MKKILAAAVASFFAIFLLVCPKAAFGAVSEAISTCLEVIVPSLFAFSATSIFLQNSGLFRVILKPFTFLLSKLLHFDEEICGVFLLANFGGYPVGITLISALLSQNRITEKDAEALLCCCFGSGPSFIIGIVGVRVFGSIALGAAIFAACFLSSLIIAFFVGRHNKITLKPAPQNLSLTSRTFVSSVSSAAKAMFSVCLMIIVFSIISAALRQLRLLNLAEKLFSIADFGDNSAYIFPSILDVTHVKDILPTQSAPSIIAALLSFGGVCVFLQTSALANNIRLSKFLLSRLPAAALAAPLAALLALPLAPASQALAALAPAMPPNPILSLCTLAMSAILLLNTRSASADGALF